MTMMPPPLAAIEPNAIPYLPMAGAADMTSGMFASLVQDIDPAQLPQLMIRASRSVEAMCGRRFVPFATLESHRAEGVDPDEYGGNYDIPLDLYGSLGRSRQRSMPGSQMARHLWLEQYAPRLAEYWTYSISSIEIIRTYGDSQIVPANQVEGPEPDSGHIRLGIGMWVPVGSTIRVSYSGGYSPIPDDLVEATRMRAAKLAIVEAQPQVPKGDTLAEIDLELTSLLAPWAR